MTIYLLAQQIAELFLVMIMGYVLAKLRIVQPDDSRVLSTISLYLVMPCVIIQAFQIEYTKQICDGLLLAILTAVIIHIILLGLTFLCGKSMKLSPVEKMSAMYSNAGNLIIPIVSSVLGTQWIIYTSAFMVIQLILLWTHGRMMISGARKFKLRELVLNINFISIIVGLFLFGMQIMLPDIVNNTIASIGGMIGPICMLTAGILFAGINVKKLLRMKRIYLVAFLRMIVFPLFILIILKVSKLENLANQGTTILLISFLATMTPTAATVTQMTQVYGGDTDIATGIYVITTLVAIVTMPLFVLLYQM